ncbi:CRISPR-associated protein Cmr3 [bacterium]|nr:CRISPR-associated protein Cmr3 [bacterium]
MAEVISSLWIIEPRDPLIVRDGRPFTTTPGARAKTLLFPFPSTTTGALRTRAGTWEVGKTDANRAMSARVRQMGVRGPLLAEVGDDNHLLHLLAPAPADAVLFKPDEDKPKSEQERLRRMVPLEHAREEHTDLQHAADEAHHLSLVGLSNPDPRKPDRMPPFWFWTNFESWLSQPDAGEINPETLGIQALAMNQRTHVSMKLGTRVGEDGMLFETQGLEFSYSDKEGLRRLALVVAADIPASESFTIHEGLSVMGGERRTVMWRKSDCHLPSCCDTIVQAILKQRACRLVLLTPAYFEHGFYPTWLPTHSGVTPSLHGIAIQKPMVVSGWDLEVRQPKPIRRLAPAGTVLFLKLPDRVTPDQIKAWITATWMQCMGDDEQSRRDGFGLAVLGVWDGKPQVIA